ncbi:similar to Saccharomyces cerevisiae YER061C CEM1 Mitochondrial beta-keto-acyl synthase with possible role in fatty acid synthesis [Maudiozyma barnettii]|uniref:beta-ketoacyl-[acyl-carrier-protein] synthase I n=1 Tax=Maudiozyma barnettii TaxID=61262 RepID=A0A8H2VEJ2_9SACH|nr:fatty acid synthase CEM1 [Kazachstania barnettii]CAB4254020.1 similar to Saccharomyces cerevisiae YER061C CEM1 Mitochondrial beta-keto-acyl synthase with possible role in fatty acid synthesis [Kazachstania barnettii]CAD1781770.1 similar to Saccharomyces cerevisiae YER061C CEM1 Mitochondrial beta-keto-acyl synthase with possible role in fatty acid synthesis [Kazachstania barnettii]
MSRRVVITGVDCITPLGNSVKESWSNLLNSKQCLTEISHLPNYKTLFEPHIKHLPTGLRVGKCKPYNWNSVNTLFTSQDHRRMSSMMKTTIAATFHALNQARLLDTNRQFPETINPHRVSTSVGTGLPAIHDIYEESISMALKNKKPSPMFIPKVLGNMIAGAVSIKFNSKGPSQTISTACATGNNSIMDGYHNIKNNYSDVAIVGATEDSLHPLTVAGFHRLKSLSTTSNSRPFDKGRDGFVISEGTGVMILEELEHAKKRIHSGQSNVKILAELVGCGLSSDAYHITSPMENGKGAQFSIEMALRNANVTVDEVNYVNAHATSTPVGDLAELMAISKTLSDTTTTHHSPLYISSNKGSMGHLLGASGLVESIFTVLSLQTGIIPHTLNLKEELELPSESISSRIKLVKGNPIKVENMRYAISNSFGFGGVNTALLFKKWEQ